MLFYTFGVSGIEKKNHFIRHRRLQTQINNVKKKLQSDIVTVDTLHDYDLLCWEKPLRVSVLHVLSKIRRPLIVLLKLRKKIQLKDAILLQIMLRGIKLSFIKFPYAFNLHLYILHMQYQLILKTMMPYQKTVVF